MKSIQTKFIALILGCVLLCSIVIGGAGILNAKRVVDSGSAQLLNLLCDSSSKELDALLSRIEQSVKTLSVYALDRLESVERLKSDQTYLEEYTANLEPVALNAAGNTEGALAVYVRYNPSFTPPTSGLFWSKTDRDGSFQKLVPTDFSGFNPTDNAHVGWYYTPVKAGAPVWMDPYINQNIDVKMISYVIPIYMDNETVGVVGMDIDFGVLEGMVEGIKAYQSGYAFLTDGKGTSLFHSKIPINVSIEELDPSLVPLVREMKNGTSGSTLFPYAWDGVDKKLAFRTLRNGMRLVVTAPVAEIDADKNSLIVQSIVATALIAALAVTVTIIFTRQIVRPLKELNTAAQRIASGDLSVSITHQTKDEVGTLADSFQTTVDHLQKYIGYINSLAYRDSLTGVKNKTAYQETAQQIEERMRSGHPEFAVVVLDVNGLKAVNDNYGHDFGDMLLIDASRLICKVFKHSPIYRVGGDEFVVILEGVDLESYNELLEEFEREMVEQNKLNRPDRNISIARGIAIYQSSTDLVFANVFKRADDAMYQNKATMKASMSVGEHILSEAEEHKDGNETELP